MRFEILGTLRVHDGENPVEVTGTRLRILLAALLAHAGEVVPADVLAEFVWDGEPPQGAGVTLRSHVKRLRQALGPVVGLRLITLYPGYLIQAGLGEADVLQFGALCRQCGAAASAGEWSRVSAWADEALGLWRGRPLADVASERLAREEVPRLERLHLQALEWHAEAGLRLGRHGEMVPRLQELAAGHPLQERFCFQLMLALYRSGRPAEALHAFQAARAALAEALGVDPGPELRQLHQRILTEDPSLAWPPPQEATAAAQAGAGRGAGSPYRGLNAFGEGDAVFFFGRETATGQVLERMSRCLDAGGMLVVSGVSGAGKSSLLQAGVLPTLCETGLPSAPRAAGWPCRVLTPGRSPLGELAVQVAPLAGADAGAVRQALETDPAAFALTARQAALGHQRHPAAQVPGGDAGAPRLLLIVDQFEQLFTLCPQEEQRHAFITALHAAATNRQGPEQAPAALVVLGVRADFEVRCAGYPQLADAVQDRYLLLPMTGRQLQMVITGPARQAGSRVDADLTDTLLREITAGSQPPAWETAARGVPQAAVLPLLSHALDQSWRHRRGSTLSLADYERTGGIESAVADSAQRAYHRLTPRQQASARVLFLRMTAASSDGIDTTATVTLSEHTARMTADQKQDVQAVVDAFVAERLLTVGADSAEISHEVLLAAWPLLRDTWLADSHADRIIRTRLTTATTEWESRDRDPSYLYSGSLLQAADGMSARAAADPGRYPLLTAVEQDFLRAGHRAQHRAARWRQASLAVLTTLTLILALTTALVIRANSQAAYQRDIAISEELISQSQGLGDANPALARLLAVAAWRLSPSLLTTTQARLAMLDAAALPGLQVLDSHGGPVLSVTFSPGGKILASASNDGTVRLWNTATGQPVRTLDSGTGGVLAVVFSSDGKTLASGNNDGTVRLWNTATGQPTGIPLAVAGTGAVLSMALSPDGKTLASGSTDGTVRLWRTFTGRPAGILLAAAGTGAVLSMAFSPDGKTLASGNNDGKIRLWNTATGQPAGTPLTASGTGGVLSMAFSPDGKTLASGSDDGKIRVWNTATGQPAGTPLAASTSPVDSVAFSPDGKTLASGSTDGTVRLWNTATGQPVGTPLAAVGTGGVLSVAFSPDGKTLASGSTDGTVRLWNTATGQPARTPLTASTSPVTSVAFNPDGKTLASGSTDGTVRLWNTATGQLVRTLNAPGTDRVYSVAFSPDGKILASGSTDGSIRLWNTATGQPARTPLTASTSPVTSVAFSPDGKILASVSLDGSVQLLDTATGQPTNTLLAAVGADLVLSVAFSPDGKTLASGSDDGTVRLWDTTTGQLAEPPRAASTSAVDSVAFSPDGKTLASGSDDGTVRLWDTATGQLAGTPLAAADSGRVESVAFSPDGKTLASVSGDGNIRFWNVAYLENIASYLCALAGRSMTNAEWERYVPAGPSYMAVCP